ncbi:MAG: long-chain-fatty-acid--CoA ligase [Burkholderiaceae bacterium]
MNGPELSAAQSSAPHLAHWPEGVPKSIAPVEQTIWQNLERTLEQGADRQAIVFFGRTITYGELHEQACRLAGWLQHQAGVKPGDRVMLMMQNSPQFVLASYAILRAQAVVVPVNPMTRAPELPHYFSDAQLRVAIVGGDLAQEVAKANQLPEGGQLEHLLVGRYADMVPAEAGEFAPPAAWTEWLNGGSAPESTDTLRVTRWQSALEQASVAPDPYTGQAADHMALCYTSGTTGRAKGCIHTHQTIGHNIVSGRLWGRISADQVSLSVVPMFHITGMLYAMHTQVFVGSCSVVLPRWDRTLAGRLISRYKVTHWTNIPTMVIDLLASPDIDQFDLSSLVQIGGGGAAMPEAIAKRLFDQFGLRYQEGYGLTETAAPSHSNPANNPKRQCLGIPFIGTDARVIDPETMAEVATDETGEIIVHGPQVFKGYWRNEAATQAAFIEHDGKTFFRTGDLGRRDADGYYFITDRLKRMINASGFKVWPAEVENMLYRHPAIQEACIIASRDPYRGETVKAVVVLRPDAPDTSAHDIQSWAREQMAAYKVPRLVEFVHALPKSGSGKVMWRWLQEEEAAKAAS